MNASINFTRDVGWACVGKHVLTYTRQPPYFSERNGYKRVLFRAFGYRVLYHKMKV